MNVMEYIEEKLAAGPIHMTLIDPDKQSPEKAASIAKQAAHAGTDAIMVGGSTGVTHQNLDMTVLAIKAAVPGMPVILFPSAAKALSPNLDAIYFLSVLNSKDPLFITGEQRMGAPVIKQLGLETIPMGYVIVAPGQEVGRRSAADLIEHDQIDKAIGYGLSAQYFGMKLVYFEAGSGAPQPVPSNMIIALKNAIDIPLIIGGGIVDAETAGTVVKAGADIVVTGTIAESADNVENTLKPIIQAIKG